MIEGPSELEIVNAKVQEEYEILYNFQDTAEATSIEINTTKGDESNKFELIIPSIGSLERRIISLTGVLGSDKVVFNTS